MNIISDVNGFVDDTGTFPRKVKKGGKQRSNRQSAVAAAAYQSGERLFSEYDQKQKYYAEKRGIVHTEIMLPPHAPREYADRNNLWNAAEAVEKQWNSQLARRIVLAIPREIPPEQHADLIRDYCREFFVSKGMIADFAIHDKGEWESPRPHPADHASNGRKREMASQEPEGL